MYSFGVKLSRFSGSENDLARTWPTTAERIYIREKSSTDITNYSTRINFLSSNNKFTDQI